MDRIATGRRHLYRRNILAAVEKALDACQLTGPAFESLGLRNVRIDLLVKVLDCTTSSRLVFTKRSWGFSEHSWIAESSTSYSVRVMRLSFAEMLGSIRMVQRFLRVVVTAPGP